MQPPDSSPSDHTPIRVGILDSGVGGLSVLREIRRLVPTVSLHYVGDSAWCPYGNKPAERIQARVTTIAEHLIEAGADLLVVACNSATIHAVELLRSAFPLPIVGMEPGVKPAASATRSGVVGILATEASFAGEKFHRLVDSHARGVRVITRPCPRFVELVEAGILDGPEADDAIDEAVGPLLREGTDVVVLGCTHYPFLRSAIARRIPDGTILIDTGPAVARRVRDLLPSPFPEKDPLEEAELLIETSGDLNHLSRLLPLLLPDLHPQTRPFPR